MNITLRQLQAFVAVAGAGGFTGAAEHLHVAQSVVSILVKELEAELGIRLFDRTTRRVELTEAGREFQANAQRLIADLDHAVRQTQDLVERKRGRIAVAAPPLLAATMLASAIAGFGKNFPGVQVTLMDVPTERIVARVKSGEADIGVGTFPPDEEGVECRPIAQDALMLFCAPDHGLAGLSRPRWRDLKGSPWIALTRDSGIRALVEYGYKRAGLSIQPVYEVTQITTALALVEAGLGVSVLPTYALAAARRGRIVAHRLDGPIVSRDIVMISRRGRSLPPAAEDFMAQVSQTAVADVSTLTKGGAGARGTAGAATG
jgi:DNA-binding transcriptional LysR family regulator